MKGLSVLVEKAKRYDEAVINGSRLWECGEITRGNYEYIFPALKDSEDEKMKKIISDILLIDSDDIREILDSNNVLMQDINDWLEKQGKKKSIDDLTPQEVMDIAVDKCFEQGEQKPVDKVEPKFRDSDWVIDDDENVFHITIDNNKYQLETLEGKLCHCSYKIIERKFRLWTIKDAKVGDILFQDLMGGKTFIFDGINPEMAILYSFIINNDGEDVLPYDIGKPNTGIGDIEENKNIIHPATKEQRDLLFQKMHDAGYEWDAKKKGPKKIEQKPVYKVEPKFKVGDWVVFKNHHHSIYQVEKIENGYYILRHTHGGTFRVCILHDEDLRLWTIQDAKDGDILVIKLREKPFIFKGLLDEFHPKSPVAYCGINFENEFMVSAGVSWWTCEEVEPATKEQRDKLMKAMAEDGYTFDFNKKALKKIEQKPTDEEMKEALRTEYEKGRADVIAETQKHAWSEEDKNNILFLTSIIEECFKDKENITLYGDTVCANFTKENVINRLKSIRPQNTWKPSDDEMDALSNALSLAKNCGEEWGFDLRTLYEQLKKLKEGE